LSCRYEFIDTIFIALRHAPLDFLHVYHHVLTLFVTWVGLYGNATFQWAGVVTNTFVHTLMYYYYFKSTLGWTTWWKMYLTQLQMIQFWFNTGTPLLPFLLLRCSFGDSFIHSFVVVLASLFVAVVVCEARGWACVFREHVSHLVDHLRQRYLLHSLPALLQPYLQTKRWKIPNSR